MRVRFAGLLLLAAAFVSAKAQTPASSVASTKGPIHLRVVVTNGKDGKPVPDLAQSSFTVLDNGAAEPIQTFRAVTGQTAPVKILLVIDAVNMDFSRVAYARQQIDTFLRANGGHLAQPTAMAIFTDTQTQLNPGYTTDGNALAQSFDQQVIGLRALRRSAGFYGAAERLDLSLRTTGQLLERATAEPGRKFIVWITPGWPLLSGPEVEFSSHDQQQLFAQIVAFSNDIRSANVTMYAVDPLGAGEGPGRTYYFEEFVKGVSKPSQALPGDLGAQVLAVQSGGQFVGSNNDIGVLLRRCFDDASASYEITYQPPPAEKANEYHHIQIRMAEPHMVARALQGYYAQP